MGAQSSIHGLGRLKRCLPLMNMWRWPSCHPMTTWITSWRLSRVIVGGTRKRRQMGGLAPFRATLSWYVTARGGMAPYLSAIWTRASSTARSRRSSGTRIAVGRRRVALHTPRDAGPVTLLLQPGRLSLPRHLRRPRHELLGRLAFEDRVRDGRDALRIGDRFKNRDKLPGGVLAEPSDGQPLHQLPLPLNPATLNPLGDPLLQPLSIQLFAPTSATARSTSSSYLPPLS